MQRQPYSISRGHEVAIGNLVSCQVCYANGSVDPVWRFPAFPLWPTGFVSRSSPALDNNVDVYECYLNGIRFQRRSFSGICSEVDYATPNLW